METLYLNQMKNIQIATYFELQIKLDKAKSLIKKAVATSKKKKLKRTCVELIAETFKLEEKQTRKKYKEF